jgi:hypothetical protein
MALTEIAGQTDLKRVRLWADPDRTPISIGGQHRQASRLVDGLIRAPNGWDEVRAMPILGKKPDLIQVADAVAFISRRAIEIKGSSPNNDRLNRLFGVLDANTRELKMTAI